MATLSFIIYPKPVIRKLILVIVSSLKSTVIYMKQINNQYLLFLMTNQGLFNGCRIHKIAHQTIPHQPATLPNAPPYINHKPSIFAKHIR